jgi:hypothetical protein
MIFTPSATRPASSAAPDCTASSNAVDPICFLRCPRAFSPPPTRHASSAGPTRPASSGPALFRLLPWPALLPPLPAGTDVPPMLGDVGGSKLTGGQRKKASRETWRPLRSSSDNTIPEQGNSNWTWSQCVSVFPHFYSIYMCWYFSSAR